MRNIFHFPDRHPLHQGNVLAHLLCHVTYVTVFNIFLQSFFFVKPAESIEFFFYMSKTFPNMLDIYQQEGNVLIYLYLNNTY